MVSAWFETTLPTLLRNYDLYDIFDADKFGIFYQPIHLKGNVQEENIVKYD